MRCTRHTSTIDHHIITTEQLYLIRIIARKRWIKNPTQITCHPIRYLRSTFLSLLVVTQIRGHIRSRLLSPLPTTVRAFHFHREKTSALSSFVDSRLIAPTHAMMGDLSSSSFYLHINLQPHHDGNRTPANAVINNSIRGPLLLQHPGVCLYKNTPWTIDNRQ